MRTSALGCAALVALAHAAYASTPRGARDDALVRLDRAHDAVSAALPERHVIREMLRAVAVDRKDIVYELGCADGRAAISAAQAADATGVCVEEDADWTPLAMKNAQRARVLERVRFVQANPMDVDMKDATVVLLSRPPHSEALRHKLIMELAPGTRVVAHDFDLAEWKPDATGHVGPTTINVWVVPAAVHGRWTFKVRGETVTLELRQNFQELTGTVRMGSWEAPIRDGRLRGSRITFFARPDPNQGPMKFDGRVRGDRMEGLRGVRNGAWRPVPWVAAKRPGHGTLDVDDYP